jgi:hypothetical protein
MTVERDAFRIDLRSAKLCMDLDCNTIFDATRYRDCPTCGSIEFYPLEPWLNRRRAWPESTTDRRDHARDGRMRASRLVRRYGSMSELVRRKREAVGGLETSG